MTGLQAPFPWFGGKRRVAGVVWSALGDVDTYVEPFAGSLAVLLARPHQHRNLVETVNDADGFVANVWRSLASDPDAVARWADWPVTEVDLLARHLWLVEQRDSLVGRLESDPEWCDPKVAGWWLWGQCAWIGGGWCAGTGPWVNDEGTVRRRTPGDDRPGVRRKLPHLGDPGRGVHRPGVDVAAWFAALAARLRRVRVCCGDWSRVLTPGATNYGGTVGVFLDPPYLGDVRDPGCYAVDDHAVANDVREWALANGDDPRYRIVLAGYTAEHDHLMPGSWRRHRWSASAAYQTTASAARGAGNMVNRHDECLWLSPHCVDTHRQLDMFGGGE